MKADRTRDEKFGAASHLSVAGQVDFRVNRTKWVERRLFSTLRETKESGVPKMEFDSYVFSKQPGFDEPEMRKVFKQAVPLRTVVIYCYDPRAVGIPEAVAKALPGEVYPGEILLDATGRKVASTATIFPVVVAGGRAVDALRSITVAQHLFGIANIVVVHHTYCGATSFTAEGLITAFRVEQGVDISSVYARENIAIPDYRSSLTRDVHLIREAKGTPERVNIYGYLYNIDDETLTMLVEDCIKKEQQECNPCKLSASSPR
jgi:carbonic anhydrase